MPKVFVHGNPETAAIWRVLFRELRARGVDDLEALAPPGFGAPVPEGFEPTRIGYRDWLIGELEGMGKDIDLVGHDWGAGHVYSVLAERPDLLRSWAADCGGLVHPDYVWHDAAQAWQTPGLGEQAMADLLGLSAEQRAATWNSFGLPEEIAREIAAAQDDEMGRCILALYRSAKQPTMVKLGEQLRAGPRRPGLVIVPSEDPFAGTHEMYAAVATDLGARTLALEGLGHWWMFEGSARAADALVAHWNAA
ncbi:MAG: alpha/beta hydrolase [Proteobacteria bacterium]|nr:alpha/beta hydrolase [Pseudomonadota bacterium]